MSTCDQPASGVSLPSAPEAATTPEWRHGVVPGEVPLAFGRTGHGPQPVVGLHGITSHHRSFNGVAGELRHPDGIAALDLRGRGDSGKPAAGSYGLDAHVSDVIRLLDHLQVERGVLVGHSMGAFVALKTALTHPHRVRGVVLVDGGWPRPEQPPAALPDDVRAGLERAFGRLELVFDTHDDYLDYWFPGAQLAIDELPDELADSYRYDLAATDAGLAPKAVMHAATEDAASVFGESPTTAELQRVTCPVSLVVASEGFVAGSPPLIADETRHAMTALLPVQHERVIPGASHYSLMFAPHARHVAEAVEALLQSRS